jgi:predicted HicB family RNase H-like nuclease
MKDKIILLRVRIPQHLHKKLKVESAKRDMSMQELIAELLEALDLQAQRNKNHRIDGIET